ncbi:non-structural maintenance of chromosomes element 4 homolog A-like [Hordeum vulgare subsp. vulgare]|uniref:Non-structural maintenance of chromosomes element 4 n=1 Tax=Hordeum vulgare subsp. vulgare TaxID=112509 RepID=A0A8I6YYC3_HORVV|nr:non-structural maintenance of chromosomes element 4 homolog A-like [Hordeum vulgare subsp. vulgare]
MAEGVAEEGRRGEEPVPVTPAAAAAEEEEEGSQGLGDRRLLRSRYLAVKSQINDDKDEIAGADSVRFQSVISQVETLHQHVINPREQIADAEALLDIASSLAASVRSQSALGITPSYLVAALLNKFGTQGDADGEGASLRWGHVGLAASHVFMAVPGCCTMFGPMTTEVMPRRKHITRKRTAKPCRNDRPEQLADPETTTTDTDKNMAALFNVLRRKKKVRLENLVLNRISFAQTVENIFALSFLVKDGRVEIDVNDDGHHIVCPRNAPAASAVGSGEVVYNHFVFRYDFKDWQLMKGIVPEGEELMLHRPPSVSTSGGNTQAETPSRSTPGGNHQVDVHELSTPGGNEDPATPAHGTSWGNNEPEMHAHTTSIRKHCRNRGLVMQARQDEVTAMDTQEATEDKQQADAQDEAVGTVKREAMAMEDREMAKGRQEIVQTYKRKRSDRHPPAGGHRAHASWGSFGVGKEFTRLT